MAGSTATIQKRKWTFFWGQTPLAVAAEPELLSRCIFQIKPIIPTNSINHIRQNPIHRKTEVRRSGKKIKYESVLNLQLIWKDNPLLFYRYFSGVDGRVERQLVESDCGSFGAVSEKHFQRLQKCRPRCKQYIFPLFYCNYKWYTGASNIFCKFFSLHILLLFFPHTWSYEE